jgi:hypothetical protein
MLLYTCFISRLLLSFQAHEHQVKLDSSIREQERVWNERETELSCQLDSANTRYKGLERELEDQKLLCESITAQV